MAFVRMLMILALSAPALAAEKKGVTLPDTVTEQNHALTLNGLGVRKAFGVVSVYVGGLYLEKTSHDAEAILKSKEWKKLVLHFLMDVEREKITDAWQEGFRKNCKSGCEAFDESMKTLNSWMANMRTHDEMIFVMAPDSLTVTVKGQLKGTIQKENFPQQFLAIFLGESPPNSAL